MSKIADAKAHLENSKFWQELSDEAKEDLFQMFRELNPKSPEELIRVVLVGNCPKCGSENTKDCETVVDLEDSTIGLCLDCGFSWCLECGYEITGKICAHWDVCENCQDQDDEGACLHGDGYSTECSLVQDFMKERSKSSDPKGGEPG